MGKLTALSIKQKKHKSLSHYLIVFFCLTILFSSSIAAAFVPAESRVPGGVAIFKLGDSTKKPSVKFNKKSIAVVKRNKQWVAVLGIPLSTKPEKRNARWK